MKLPPFHHLPQRVRTLLAMAIVPLTLQPASAAEAFLEKTTLWESGVDGYARYRIPGIAITAKGTVLVTCDARKDPSLGDWSDIDLFLRRSPDLGKTWEAPQKLAHRGVHPGLQVQANAATVGRKLGAADQFPFNNQTLVIDRKSGDILFVYCINYDRCFQRRSRDEGVTWSTPEEITAPLAALRKLYPFKVFATGPNHGIQLSKGRLIIPVWLSTGGGQGGHRPSVVSSLYSDDGGVSWQAGEIAAQEVDPLVNPSETVAVELAGGGVMFSMRTESLQHRRGIAYSPDGATNWTRPEFVNDLVDPVCMAGIDRLSWASPTERSRLIYSYCDNGTEADPRSPSRFFVRKNLTVRLSYDEGRTWPVSRAIEPGLAGYSDITVAPDRTIFCLFEQGSATANATKSLVLAHFNLEWLSNNRDAFNVSAP
ncbi:MAG: sialidase family protein [Opitutus sp.]